MVSVPTRRKHADANTCLAGKFERKRLTLVLLRCNRNMGSRLAKKISPDAGLDYAKAAKMYEMAATFSLLKMGICAEKEDASQACLSLFLSASCTALHVRCSEQGTLADDFMLRNALDLIRLKPHSSTFSSLLPRLSDHL
jgi:hypothetical protein